jgi:hypothetical protein
MANDSEKPSPKPGVVLRPLTQAEIDARAAVLDKAAQIEMLGREALKRLTEKATERGLSVASTKTLTLTRGGVEQGVVRKSFSHGRSKAVVVEKVKRRLGTPVTEEERLAIAAANFRQLRESRARQFHERDDGFPEFQRQEAYRAALNRAEEARKTEAKGLFLADLEALDKIPPLNNLTELRGINLANTLISDLSPLSGAPWLTGLNLHGTGITDLSPISRLRSLRFLRIAETLVSDISPAGELTELIRGAGSGHGLEFEGAFIEDGHIRALSSLENPRRTIEAITSARKARGLPDLIDEEPPVSEEDTPVDEDKEQASQGVLPPAEVIPVQIGTAISFTSANYGPLGLVPDAPPRTIDPEQVELYARLRKQLTSLLENVPTQERVQITEQVNDFLRQPLNWTEVQQKKVLWICGNELRNVLAQHDAVVDDPDPHYAKLPIVAAEALRRPVETWNVVVLGDITLRELDAQRLGPRENEAAKEQLDYAKLFVSAATQDRQITNIEAGAAIEASFAAANASTDNIHARQARELARGTTQNLVVQILRGAYRVAQDLLKPQSEEARQFANEYKAGIYKKLGEWTMTGAVAATISAGTAVYLYGVPFFEFVVTQGPSLKEYIAVAFQSEQLAQIVDSIMWLRLKLLGK